MSCAMVKIKGRKLSQISVVACGIMDRDRFGFLGKGNVQLGLELGHQRRANAFAFSHW